MISFVAQAYEPLIREDRIWEYDIDGSDIWKFKFDGTERINDKTYHKLVYWSAKQEQSIVSQTVAYMRESGNEVYLLLQQENLEIDQIGTFPVPKNQEICLYRFGMYGENKTVFENIPVNTDYWNLFNLEAELSTLNLPVFCKVLTHNGKNWNAKLYHKGERNYDWFDGFSGNDNSQLTIIEGIGNVGRGFLHAPGCVNAPISKDSAGSFFRRQTDLYGNVVFDAEWVTDQSGVTDIKSESGRHDDKSYDLQGKPLENPQPGTIYIQNGEKHIAK